MLQDEDESRAAVIARMQQLAGNELQVRVNAVPLDENSAQPALIQNSAANKELVVAAKAGMQIIFTEIPDTLSTGQNFQYTIRAQISENIMNARAQLQLPATLGVSPLSPLPLDQNQQAVWSLQVPAAYAGTGLDIIQVTLLGEDENSGLALTVHRSEPLVIERKARLKLSYPSLAPSAVERSGLVSRGQEIQIQIQPEYSIQSGALNYAALSGMGSIVLDSSIVQKGFKLLGGKRFEQTFSSLGEALTWRLKAPQQDLTISLNLKFKQLPLDKNDRLAVELDKDSAAVAIPIRVRQKSVTVALRPALIADSSFTQAQTNAPLLAFEVSNAEYDDSLKVSGIEIGFYSALDAPSDQTRFSARALVDMLKSLRIMDAEEYANLPVAKPSSAAVFGDLNFTDTTGNPVKLEFADPAKLAPGSSQSFVVVADFQNNTLNRSFRTALHNVKAYDFDPDSPLAIIDTSGNSIDESALFISTSITVLSTDPKMSFGNYPNPFGRTTDYTNIVFNLEQASDVKIRIFTLIGELVWTKELSGLSPRWYEGLIKWDGRNDNGYRVLNGVYLCYIDIMPLNGQPNKRYMTKIAYIK
jgi:hypothetical protein